jgi:ubiquitin-conjugating enzyme E2 Q
VVSDDTDDEDIDDIKFLAYENNVPTRARGLKLPQTHQEPQTDFRPGSLDFSNLPQLALPSYATKPAQQTIQRELQKLQNVQSTTPLHELGWYLDFDKIDNMFQWIVELHSFEPSLPLAKDMKAAGITSIVLEIRFLRGFPMTPPFIRVIQPKFLPFALGGGGHVTGGGALCMELLTNTGWSPVNSMESVLLQVRLAICNLDPKPARLAGATPGTTQYSIREAVEAYTRAATTHGWEIPADLKEATMQ